jgi:hypothetical protein
MAGRVSVANHTAGQSHGSNDNCGTCLSTSPNVRQMSQHFLVSVLVLHVVFRCHNYIYVHLQRFIHHSSKTSKDYIGYNCGFYNLATVRCNNMYICQYFDRLEALIIENIMKYDNIYSFTQEGTNF